MRRLLVLFSLCACGSNNPAIDAPPMIDALVCDCILPGDSYFPDSTLLGPGTHTFQIDIADGDMTAAPTGNWVNVTFDQMNFPVPAIHDSVSGQATTVSLDSLNWTVQDENTSNWTAGDLGWMQSVAAQDTWGGSTMAGFPGTLTLANLDGRYKVEIVVAYYNDNVPHRVQVNGATTTTTYKGATKDSATWKPLDDGTTAGDWMVWPDVNPSAGAITIEILPGRLNAVRFSPP